MPGTSGGPAKAVPAEGVFGGLGMERWGTRYSMLPMSWQPVDLCLCGESSHWEPGGFVVCDSGAWVAEHQLELHPQVLSEPPAPMQHAPSLGAMRGVVCIT